MTDTSLSVLPIDRRERIPEGVIRAMVSQIAEQFQPRQIILFGSYAYGKPSQESDVDLLVVMATTLRKSEQELLIRQSINPLFGVDILVYTPEQLKQRISLGDHFLQEIVKRGVVLYESPDA